MSTELGSGTVGGVGFGNKTAPDGEDIDNSDTRFDKHHTTDAYSGATGYGSGSTGGVGAGNKMTAASSNENPDTSGTRLEVTHSEPYSGGAKLKSGTVGGPGYGNKTAGQSTDSTMGKLMEKAGGMLGKDDLVEKGHAKREAAGAFTE